MDRERKGMFATQIGTRNAVKIVAVAGSAHYDLTSDVLDDRAHRLCWCSSKLECIACLTLCREGYGIMLTEW